jgi:hypothetical protein
MAYLREEKETLEIKYPLETVWATIPKVVKLLQWKIEEKDLQNHKLKLKTKGAFLSYGSIFFVELKVVDKKTTRMNINAETPVTTLTAVADFGRTRDRIEQFIGALAEKMSDKSKKKQTDEPNEKPA